MAKGQKGLTCWVKPLPEGLPQRIMDCPVLPCILPSTAVPWYTEIHKRREKQRAEGLPGKGWCLGSHEIEGSPCEFWDGIVGSATPCPTLTLAITFPRAASSGKSMVWRWRKMRRIPSRYTWSLLKQPGTAGKAWERAPGVPQPSTCLNVC